MIAGCLTPRTMRMSFPLGLIPRNVCGMSSRQALILALALNGLGALLLAYDLHHRCTEASVQAVASGEKAVLAEVHKPYVLVLVSLAAVNVAVFLLLRSAFREERSAALRRAQESPPDQPAPTGAVEDDSALMEPSVAAPESGTEAWGSLAPWSAEHEASVTGLWMRTIKRREGGWPSSEEAFERFFASRDFDAEASAVALSRDGRFLGAVLALRQRPMEDEGYWWLEAPGVIACVLVEPAQRLKGIGRALLRRSEEQARSRRRPRLFAGGLENFVQLVPGVPGDDYASRMFLLAMGYREVRRTCHMVAEMKGYEVPEELREREERLGRDGYRFAAAEAKDLKAFESFVERTGLDRPSRRVEKFQMGFERFYFVWNDERIGGYIQVSAVNERMGGLSGLYFSRDHRGKGLGSVLLVKAHELWARQGVQKAAVWTYPEAATRFYPRAGFVLVQEWVQYMKDLAHSWDDSAFVQRWR